MSNYFTITDKSMLKAIGPFKETSTWQASGNFLAAEHSRTAYACPVVEHEAGEITPIHIADQQELLDSAYATMLASEAILAQAWNSPEDDKAWADL